MSVRKLPDGGNKPWLAEVYPSGRDGPRKRKRFATKGEATAWEKWQLEETNSKPWLPESHKNEVDSRRLTDLVDVWYRMHGISLSSGDSIKALLVRVCTGLGNPVAADFTVRDFAAYRESRLSGQLVFSRYGKGGKPAGPSSVNREHTLIVAMFNELIRLGEWRLANPLLGLRLFSIPEGERGFLTHDEISALISVCEASKNPDLATVVKLCLATGARWSEVELMTGASVSPGRITFLRTKGKRNRTVPITDELYDLLPQKSGRLFSDCYEYFRTAMSKSGIALPDGQSSHVLRHTFASHFMMSGGNILVLQRILGHTSITMTMRYAHFAPDHLDEAMRLNPLATSNKWRQNGDRE
jgi:integrase